MMDTKHISAKAHILYVDDEPNNLFAFKSVFRRSYEVATALGATEAIAMLEKGSYDLVLSDHKMPGMTGVDLCKYIVDHFPTLKTMIISGYTHEEEIQSAVEHGIVAKSVAKPWDTEHLSLEIKAILD